MTWRFCPRCANELVERDDAEGAARKACSDAACGFVHYDNPTPVVAAIVRYGDDVVLTQSVGWPDTWFGLVAGFLERGEEPQSAVLREVNEELCVDGVIEEFVGLYAFEQMNQVIMAYVVRIDAAPSAGPELQAIKLVHVDKVKPWPIGTGPALADWLARRK